MFLAQGVVVRHAESCLRHELLGGKWHERSLPLQRRPGCIGNLEEGDSMQPPISGGYFFLLNMFRVRTETTTPNRLPKKHKKGYGTS